MDTGGHQRQHTNTRRHAMSPKKSPPSTSRRPARPAYWGMTPNQVVAYNLALARQLRGLTQEQACEALEPYLGERWSTASLSQAERSVAGRFVRRFDAEEVVAFARAFEVPVTWFFLPPPPWRDGRPVRLSAADARRFGVALTELVDLVFGDDGHHRALLGGRLLEFFSQLGEKGLSRVQERIA